MLVVVGVPSQGRPLGPPLKSAEEARAIARVVLGIIYYIGWAQVDDAPDGVSRGPAARGGGCTHRARPLEEAPHRPLLGPAGRQGVGKPCAAAAAGTKGGGDGCCGAGGCTSSTS